MEHEVLSEVLHASAHDRGRRGQFRSLGIVERKSSSLEPGSKEEEGGGGGRHTKCEGRPIGVSAAAAAKRVVISGPPLLRGSSRTLIGGFRSRSRAAVFPTKASEVRRQPRVYQAAAAAGARPPRNKRRSLHVAAEQPSLAVQLERSGDGGGSVSRFSNKSLEGLAATWSGGGATREPPTLLRARSSSASLSPGMEARRRLPPSIPNPIWQRGLEAVRAVCADSELLAFQRRALSVSVTISDPPGLCKNNGGVFDWCKRIRLIKDTAGRPASAG
ncbi:hypothetical protein HPB50_019114 [Hyalomma asiaticum]|uniref:Uncharacterized protein n=1 Tax=Hyalomma asiaticum TaxID=266040 RepID=A0ACB7SNW9_HYAAI|nr:hypothetical protein HPB50_019114 [Hyalomma asiaticum]